ncbi:S-adenosyl-L-methionine-dependent methyltransferase [Phialemonium atrogriseum]|uniref:S-adenosyl-L-methionine-dependent methyltransferase n=1 Tax=Phialemonium atrogriseum TaxID=1093897 RepID=A0AAJ0C2H1_9PEZI|nr:S-adenosyl-L-methionine-dependent methyltransferase [Phialemonium atrogriseum]KAK1768287.1 S-adenosyl-L-methionine-dependent methyltransferase [Phialemonium atrogriseum]
MSATEPKSGQPEPIEAPSSLAPEPATATTAKTLPMLPPEHWTEVAGQDGDGGDDADSAHGDDAAESTASLTSTILRYRTIRGRTYHSEIGNAQYWGANDDGHSESLDILNHVFNLCLDGRLYVAPITDDPKKVLDIGTGTGIWAIDFADQFPGCDVIGTDISPIQPGWVPPNLRFEIEDCTREWTFEENGFDFVHIRYLTGCILDWTEFFKEAYRCLKPGGWLQSYESSPTVFSDDDTLPKDSAIAQWGPIFMGGGEKTGRTFAVVDDGLQNTAMEKAGFVDVQEKWIEVPSGGWPKDPKLREIGQFSQVALLSDVEGFILFFTNVLGWSRDQVQVYIAHLRRELRSLKHHVYYKQKIVWGRKPEAQ